MRPGVLILCVLGGLLAAAPVRAAGPVEPVSDSGLAAALQAWEGREQRLEVLRTEVLNAEGRLDPERGDRNWWNPLWQTVVTRRAQRANELTLRLQALEREQRDAAPALLDLTTRYTAQAAAEPGPATPGRSALWARADAWRVPRVLDAAEGAAEAISLPAGDPELEARRRRSAEEQLAQVQALEAYLQVRLRTLAPTDAPARQRVLDWLARTRLIFERLVRTLSLAPTPPPVR